MELMLVLRAVIAGSAMGATVEELRREVGKLKGHILSQVGTDAVAENNQVLMLQGEELMRVKKATVSEKSTKYYQSHNRSSQNKSPMQLRLS